METQDLDAIKAALEGQHSKLSAKADSLRINLIGLDESLARIDAALAALSGTPLPSPATRPSKKDRRKAPAPSASKAQVIDLIVQELAQRNAVQESDLKSLIEQKLIESGHNRMGYGLRFKEALSDPRFQLGTEGVSLRRPSPQSNESSSQGTERKSQERING